MKFFTLTGRCPSLGRAAVAAAILLSFGVAAQAQVTYPIPPPFQPNNAVNGLSNTTGVVRAKASPDECWTGLGLNTEFDFVGSGCLAGQIPKVDQGYIWGSVMVGNMIYFGTTPNAQCITEGGLTASPTPYANPYWACEFGESPYSPALLPANLGDDRPARFYAYNISTHAIQDITPTLSSGLPGAPAPPPGYCSKGGAFPFCLDNTWTAMLGVRSSTAYPDPVTGHTYILAGGPALSTSGGYSMFAYDTTLKTWVAKWVVGGVSDQRKWVVSNGVYYAPMGDFYGSGVKVGAAPLPPGGSMMRFVGGFSSIPPLNSQQLALFQYIPYCPACFSFQDVGDFDGLPTDATVSQGRIFVSEWPAPGQTEPFYAGLYMSPPIPTGGFTTANSRSGGGAQWTVAWDASKYEADPVIGASYATGALADFNGYLYWGTMNVPWEGTIAFIKKYGEPTTTAAAQAALTGTFRTASVFRSNSFTTSKPQIDILYGYSAMPVYNATTQTWAFQSDLNAVSGFGSAIPLYGAAGFNNPYNCYIWSMGIWNNNLYVGTMDWGFLAVEGSVELGLPPTVPITTLIPPTSYGADLYYFPSSLTKALPQSTSGVGNWLNYGVRNIFSYSSTQLLLGTANPMALATTGSPQGGWELVELNPSSIVTKR